MPSAGIGVDMLEIARMERTLARRPSFARRVFTEEERAYCDNKTRPAQHYAARFAAREAVLKALGTGFSNGISLSDVSVSRNDAGRPEIVLTGRAREVADEKGILEVAISLTYTHDVAVANAVAMTADVRPKVEEQPDPKAELNASFRAMRSLIDELERVENEPAVVENAPTLSVDEPADAPQPEAAHDAAPQPEPALAAADKPIATETTDSSVDDESALAPEPAPTDLPAPAPEPAPAPAPTTPKE